MNIYLLPKSGFSEYIVFIFGSLYVENLCTQFLNGSMNKLLMQQCHIVCLVNSISIVIYLDIFDMIECVSSNRIFDLALIPKNCNSFSICFGEI